MSGTGGAAVMRLIVLSAITMIAFAANSVLCRQALGEGHIDAAGFTTLRVISGVVVLWLILAVRHIRAGRGKGSIRTPLSWTACLINALMLFIYMAFFSFAYLSLDAGTGALLLFGAVQLTMFGTALLQGERFPLLCQAGLAMAAAGMVYLVSPGISAPDGPGAALMAVAGVAWGVYSLRGRGVADPLAATARNFTLCLPLVALLAVLFLQSLQGDLTGIVLALVSGGVASGCGYVLWYAILPSLGATRAATLQLSVPAIAALGGVLLLSEDLTLRLVLSSLLTLGGVAIVLARRAQ